ncbi:MAG: hypothetical protein ACLFTK_04945 [Anaerolineales bacterium]
MLNRIVWLAQTETTGLDDFFGQIAGLLIVTVGAGVIWMLLMLLIYSRSRERRRRQAQGLPAPPSAWQQLRGWLNPGQSSTPTMPEFQPAPLPDDDALVAPLPTPALDDLTQDLQPTHQPSRIDPPSATQPQVLTIEPSETADAAEDDMVEVMRVWRDLINGELIIDMKGQRFRQPSETKDSRLEQRFTSLLAELDTLAGRGQPVPPPAPSVPPPAAAEPAEDDSIARQIDAFLQTRLAASDDYAGRDIHVRPSPEGGVAIHVDGAVYEAVGDVEEEGVRQFLQETIQAWERQS